MVELLFATSNKHKVLEANDVGKEFDVSFKPVGVEYPEIRSDGVIEVAREGVEYVYQKIGKPVLVEDSGLFINALNGFPGAYSSMVFKKVGNEGILKLLAGVDDRDCHFTSAIAYHDGNNVNVFEGVVEGRISSEISGEGGFGYDPIFIPSGYEETFSQMLDLKNEMSHRRHAVEALCRQVAGL